MRKASYLFIYVFLFTLSVCKPTCLPPPTPAPIILWKLCLCHHQQKQFGQEYRAHRPRRRRQEALGKLQLAATLGKLFQMEITET